MEFSMAFKSDIYIIFDFVKYEYLQEKQNYIVIQIGKNVLLQKGNYTKYFQHQNFGCSSKYRLVLNERKFFVQMWCKSKLGYNTS